MSYKEIMETETIGSKVISALAVICIVIVAFWIGGGV